LLFLKQLDQFGHFYKFSVPPEVQGNERRPVREAFDFIFARGVERLTMKTTNPLILLTKRCSALYSGSDFC
jgi:hypothetical protein